MFGWEPSDDPDRAWWPWAAVLGLAVAIIVLAALVFP